MRPRRRNFNLAEPQVHLARILTTPQPDNNVRNLKNDKAQDDEPRLSARSSRSPNAFAPARTSPCSPRNYSEDPGSSANGGDLGFVSETALEKVQRRPAPHGR
jgi:hypothetical protein